jgi:hypothetical protein
VLVGGALLLVCIAFVIYGLVNQKSNVPTTPVGNIQCNPGEQLSTHYHAHLTILLNGNPVTVPGQIGITSDCIYWMHTHDNSGVLHIEAPANQKDRTFTLGDFFAVWNQPLSATQVATINLSADQKLVAYVDGKPYTGDPKKIVLKSHTEVVLEITPPTVEPPPGFTWTSDYPQ